MAISIKNDEADRLARELAELTGESLTDAIVKALRERLERHRRGRRRRALSEELLEIGQRCSRLPLLDERTEDEVLGFDERGLPR